MTFEALQNELVKSMKERNRIRKNVIADMVTCAKNMAIAAGTKDNITEEIVDAAILKSKKTCQEQIDTCPANRPDILEAYKVCMGYIDELAPKMMTEDEVRDFVEQELIEMTQNYTLSPKLKGLVMKNIMPELKGKADGKLINKIVTELLG
jgi:hypothetical protein